MVQERKRERERERERRKANPLIVIISLRQYIYIYIYIYSSSSFSHSSGDIFTLTRPRVASSSSLSTSGGGHVQMSAIHRRIQSLSTTEKSRDIAIIYRPDITREEERFITMIIITSNTDLCMSVIHTHTYMYNIHRNSSRSRVEVFERNGNRFFLRFHSFTS